MTAPTVADLDGLSSFARWQLASGDIDPAYPVLRAAAHRLGFDRAALADLVFLYVAYYNLASALRIIEAVEASWPPWGTLTLWLRLGTGTERRAHRHRPRLLDHLAALDQLREAYGGLDRWVDAHLSPAGPAASWTALQAALRGITGNGRWAAYKTGEILAYVGWPVAPTDAGHDFSSGPRAGLALVRPDAALTGHGPATVARLDAVTEEVRLAVELQLGAPLPVEQLETVLCDWHALATGRYYVGHDIDQQLGQLAAAPLSDEMRAVAMGARADSFEDRWRGEAAGWAGVRPELKPLWRDRAELAWWAA